MDVPSLAGDLPPGVDPIPVPSTKREAEMLLILLDSGLYPKLRSCPDEALEKEADRPAEKQAPSS